MVIENWNKFVEDFKKSSAEEQIKIIRHELRYPLTTITGFSTLLANKINPLMLTGLPDDVTSQDIDSWLKRLVEASQEMDKLIAMMYDLDE